ncbi:MAG TPA: DUF3857 domain-containing protein [Chryseolinea sp.]
MKQFSFTFLLCYGCFLSQAQKEPSKFGEVTMDELKMKTFVSDTSVAAVILFDKGETIMTQGNITITFKRHVRIKILKRDALTEWGSGEILAERGTLSKLKGATYNLENGSIVVSPMLEESIFKTRANKYVDQVRFTLPNVKEGSVIEFSYALDADALPGWQFQNSIPTARSEYVLEVPEHFEYRKQFKGTLNPTSHSKKGTQEKWVFTNVPAFKPEPFMPNKEDYVSQVTFSFSKKSWMRINLDLVNDENFGKTVSGFPWLRKQVEILLAGVKDPKEKMKILSNYVKSNVAWNGTNDIYAEDLKEVLNNRKGTAADVNFLLASMLEKANIPVEMVLLSTVGNGFVRFDVPSTRQFNYVICAAYIDTVKIFLDATEKYLPWDVLPERCLNGDGFMVSKDKFGFVDITSPAKKRTSVRAELSLNDSGGLSGKLEFIRDGYAGQEMRETLSEMGKELYLNDFKKNKAFTVSKSEFRDIESLEKPAVEVHEIDLADHGTLAGDLIYVNPFIALNLEENPFKPETREFPIDFGNPNESLYLCNITIPDNYVVDALPEPKVMMLPDRAGKYFYQATQFGNKITVVSNLQINGRIFLQDQYPNLRELFGRVITKQSEQIVLKKKQ